MNIAAVEELLREEIGLDVASIGRGVVERALRRQLAAGPGDDPAILARRLRDEPALLRRLIEDVVVPETWFFRDGKPFEVLAREAAKRRGRERPLRVLSLPCATGEEAWSIAITLREAGFGPGEFSVTARDVSAVATATARRGVYGKNSFRGEIGDWRARWLEPAGEEWRVRDEVRGVVDFAEGNLFAMGGGEDAYDFVFCRNLLIYFDAERQREALRRLRGLLAPDGLLFVGHAEAAVALRERFTSWPVARSFAFTAELREPSPVRPRVLPSPAIPAEPAPFASVRAPALEPGRGLADAMRRADRGEFAEAAALAEDHLRLRGPDAEAFYLLGLVKDAAGSAGEAEAAYRKALYWKPAHGPALMHLALLLEHRGEVAEARRLRGRAAKGGGA